MKDRSIHEIAYYNILRTSSWIEVRIKKALKPLGITHAQLNVLHLLYDSSPHPISASELKEKILVNNPDITRLMDRLVKKDLVIREIPSDNRRKINLSISEKGKKVFVEAHERGKQAVENFFEEKISEREATELRRLLHKIRK